ncbi:MAG: hypothetical protein IK099_01185 [Clostridia bacterium]|nr:hypothetical protein [Clostridia bacterium]
MKLDHYYLYGEVAAALKGFLRDYPALCSLDSIGKTREGRDILCLTVCNPETGSPEEKAAFFMDGNLHSGEVASSMAVLHILDQWLSAYGKEPAVTALLDRFTVYAIPRINADAAEVFLTTPYMTRGNTEKYYPPDNGVADRDMDGDGVIRQMRIPDPAGKWKAYEKDSRIMMARGPEDTEGTFYTLVSEGVFRGGAEDFICLRDTNPQDALDPNRQFPFEWNKDYPDKDRPTSGPEPLHDPEVRALYDFVCGHPNIAFHMDFHTYGGLHISPADFCPHLEVPDKERMQALGAAMRKRTGYKCSGIFPEGAKDIAPGSYTTWEYFERGIMAFVTELWDFHFQADPDRPQGWSMFFAESEEQFLREAETALGWDERENGGQGFKPWTPCVLPGWTDDGKDMAVEIGGWNRKFTMQNPPPRLLPGVCEKAADAALVGFQALPRLHMAFHGLRRGEGGKDILEIELMNLGYLPTCGTEMAARKEMGDDLTVSLSGCETPGENSVRVGHVDGYAKRLVSFAVRMQGKTPVTVTARGTRCGQAVLHITLDPDGYPPHRSSENGIKDAS